MARSRARGQVCAMPLFADLQLTYDPVARRADLAFGPAGPLWDVTAATPLIVSLGSERRADPGDILPETDDAADVYANPGAALPAGRPNPRRGCCGDAINPGGALTGSRLWLLDDAKQTADTRIAAIGYAAEATAWMPAPVQTDASWFRPGQLAVLANAAGVQVALPLSIV